MQRSALLPWPFFPTLVPWAEKASVLCVFFWEGGRFWSFEIWILAIWTFYTSFPINGSSFLKALGCQVSVSVSGPKPLVPWKIPPVMSNQDSGEKNARPCGLSGVMFFNVYFLFSNFWYLPKLVVWGLVFWTPGILALNILKGYPDLNPKPPNHQSTISWIESSKHCNPLIFLSFRFCLLLLSLWPGIRYQHASE